MNETETERNNNGIVQGVTFLTTAFAVVVPTAVAIGIRWWMRLGESEVSMVEILSGGVDTAGEADEADETLMDPDDVRGMPWPEDLPGLDYIIAYDDLKEATLAKFVNPALGMMIPDSARAPLRHALMDRCQQHVAWLLRIEKEERAMQRMAARGLISATDHATYTKFAERLDAEVIEVKEEAAWLCGDPAVARRASDEIWAIAVQIWQQRRTERKKLDAEQRRKAGGAAGAASTSPTKKNASDGAVRRAADAKTSLKGLKGGFLAAGDSSAAAASRKKNASAASLTNGASSSSSSKVSTKTSTSEAEKDEAEEDEAEAFRATQWPSELPGAKVTKLYEQEKAKLLRSDDGHPPLEAAGGTAVTAAGGLVESEGKQRLRQVLMQRCQSNIPLIRAVGHEEARMRACAERARWRSNDVGAPTAEDFAKWATVDAAVKAEMAEVQREAEWLGDRDGAPGMGDRIWLAAFEIHQKMAVHQDARNKELRDQHDKALRQYAAREAKAWPADLPSARHRDAYNRHKGEIMAQLNATADDKTRAALLHGHLAPSILGPEVARQLRSVLMARCQASVPIIQRLQAEAKAVRIAQQRGHVDDADFAKFQRLDSLVNQEIEDVKAEAEWLSDEAGNRRGMGDQVWPAAFQIHAKRRAEIAAQVAAQKQQTTTQAAAPAKATTTTSESDDGPTLEDLPASAPSSSSSSAAAAAAPTEINVD